jgi:hypothetical protein
MMEVIQSMKKSIVAIILKGLKYLELISMKLRRLHSKFSFLNKLVNENIQISDIELFFQKLN